MYIKTLPPTGSYVRISYVYINTYTFKRSIKIIKVVPPILWRFSKYTTKYNFYKMWLLLTDGYVKFGVLFDFEPLDYSV